ncbi:folate family ECF transporter S component [Haloimpatiens lingqiaonensis]|uniref:folate family ECF transporter S component n=1 Tax=Haloimpatiens lingqiaonensis TaxID=1380675 RepID=UPI0010FEA6EC|nr:folate family ECF transporter S component [Haloimpatiens lingqiaonensis]
MQKKQVFNTKTLVYLAMLGAIQIVLTRFLSIQTPIIRIGFGFIPYMLTAMLFGPIVGGIYGVVIDFVGVMINPAGGAYFPGFSLSAFLGAFVYGIFLYKKPKNLWRMAASVIIVTLFVDMFLNTLWLTMITGKAAYAILAPRAIKNAIMAVIKIVTMLAVWKSVGNYIEQTFIQKGETKVTHA